jgi:hypothetical protein
MTPEDIALMGDGKVDLQIQLNLLVLKQAAGGRSYVLGWHLQEGENRK